MQKNFIKIFSLIALPSMVVLFWACSSDDSSNGSSSDGFNRGAMLTDWADNIIIPSYQAFQTEMTTFKTATDAFIATPNEANLLALRVEWEDAYIAWQSIAMFEIGPADNIRFREFMNTYPTTTANIDASISSGTYDLTSLTLADEQGFPAVDYLINGLASTDADIVAFYTSNANNYKNYLSDVVDQMNTRTSTVVSDWTGTYRNTFVSSTGSSVTSSTNTMVNAFILYYEKFLRSGKIGIPAGVFSNETQPNKTESFYAETLSKDLFNEALNATQKFFRGTTFNGTTQGESLESYLDFLNTVKNGTDLSTLINNQFNTSRTTASGLNDNFTEQVNTNNPLMLSTYDELQANVVLLKTDMVSAMNISITFTDSDGD